MLPQGSWASMSNRAPRVHQAVQAKAENEVKEFQAQPTGPVGTDREVGTREVEGLITRIQRV